MNYMHCLMLYSLYLTDSIECTYIALHTHTLQTRTLNCSFRCWPLPNGWATCNTVVIEYIRFVCKIIIWFRTKMATSTKASRLSKMDVTIMEQLNAFLKDISIKLWDRNHRYNICHCTFRSVWLQHQQTHPAPGYIGYFVESPKCIGQMQMQSTITNALINMNWFRCCSMCWYFI